MSRLLVGGLIVVALLFLYLYVLLVAFSVASHCPDLCPLGDTAISILLQTLGGLISAVVVSQLAVTRPTDSPGDHLARSYKANQRPTVEVLVNFYILVWLVSGLALVIVGWVKYPTVPELTSAAKEWLGFAAAAGYAYFGVSPK